MCISGFHSAVKGNGSDALFQNDTRAAESRTENMEVQKEKHEAGSQGSPLLL